VFLFCCSAFSFLIGKLRHATANPHRLFTTTPNQISNQSRTLSNGSGNIEVVEEESGMTPKDQLALIMHTVKSSTIKADVCKAYLHSRYEITTIHSVIMMVSM
jgi:hypothetical protein